MTLAELLGRLTSFVITLLGLFVAAVIIFPTFKPGDLIAGLGITSVAIGFAFKDVLQNVFPGILTIIGWAVLSKVARDQATHLAKQVKRIPLT